MGYYDFDHFWSPEEVCAQKTTSESTFKVPREISKFFHELLGHPFCDRYLKVIRSPEPDSANQDSNFEA